MNDIKRAIELGKLAITLRDLDNDIDLELHKNELYMGYIDVMYDDKLRDLQLVEEVRHRMANLLRLIDKVCTIEQKAIAYNDFDLMWDCELRKGKMVSQMEVLRDKYEF